MAFGPQNRFATWQGRTIDQAAIDVGLRQHMLRVYNLMATGLAISGLVAWLIASTAFGSVFFHVVPTYGGYGVLRPTLLGYIGMFAPLGILLIASFTAQRMSAGATQAMYWAFVALQGIGLSVLLQAYTGASVVRVFFITAGAFAGLSLYGYTTRRSLSGFGSFLVMGLIGLVIASIVNIFLASNMLQFVIAAAGVLIFSGLIAYDTQRIKEEYVEGMGREAATKTAVWAALSLYINFINLFQFLLYFLGNRE